jgi:hypothetical protein
VRFDLYLGTNQKYVAIELKILETLRGLMILLNCEKSYIDEINEVFIRVLLFPYK